MVKRLYIVPQMRAVEIGTKRNTCQLVIGGSEDPDAPQLVREQDDDLWSEPNTEWEKPSGVWDNEW